MTRVVPVRESGDEALDRIAEIRRAGHAPLVGDSRWPAAQWDAVVGLAARSTAPSGTGWATATSGTSGAPRIVLRSAESWAASFPAVAALLDARREDSVVLPAPLSSSLTLFSVAHSLDGGPHPVLDPAAADVTATALHGTPQALRTLFAGEMASRIRTALVGGSQLEADLRAAAASRGIRAVAYYGAAELSFVAVDDGGGLRAFPGVELDLRDGEVWVRSPFVATGYLGRPGPLRRDGGWATVGDLAELDGGVLRVRGRADGAIQTASATVIPEEVEAELRDIPGVADALVFGLPAPGVGALVAALIEFDEDPGVDRGRGSSVALRRAAREQLATASRPRVWFAGAVPRTAAGKPARAEALRRVLEGTVARLD